VLLAVFSSHPSEGEVKRVLVIQSQHLLAAGILSLLNGEMDLHVFDATSSDEITLLEEIKRVDPAVLVLVDSSKFTDHVSFFSLLDSRPDLRVIVIEERKNRMYIYERQALEVRRALDLIAAIRREEQFPL
jgi:chemotaxis response regulator CheB